MRILLIGNVNNMPLQIAMGLRRHGVDATLVVTQSSALHHPRSTRLRWRFRRPGWIRDHSSLGEIDFVTRSPALMRMLREIVPGHDFAILNEMAPSIADLIPYPHAFMNTGSDLTFYGDTRLPEWRSAGWAPAFRDGRDGRAEIAAVAKFVTRQRAGIAAARFALTFPRGVHPAGDRIFDVLGFGDDRRHTWRIADMHEIRVTPVPTRGPLLVSSLARIDFRPTDWGTELNMKGTDVLIAGVAIATKAGGDVRLQLPKKGGDVSLAQSMVQEVGISDRVSWISDIPRNQYLRRMREPMVIADSLGASGPATVTHDALASGRAVLGNLQPEIWSDVFGQPYPGLHAVTPTQVAHALGEADANRDALVRLGEEGRAFAVNHLSLEANVSRLVGLIAAEI